MVQVPLIPKQAFDRVRAAKVDAFDALALLADMNRINALATIKLAGSGHPGTTMSAMEVVCLLYYRRMNFAQLGIDHPDRDIYFSSKGHDVPGVYAILYSLGILDREPFVNLRRIAGTCGHPDVSTPGIEAHTGSLGTGISKAKGMAFAKRIAGRKGHVYVMTGDGEFQEGQNFEALQSAAHHKVGNLTVIMDHNKVQSDMLVEQIIDLRDLGAKFSAFGWHVARCDGHDLRAMDAILDGFAKVTDQPKILIADTIKGKGVSFMEHTTALKANDGIFKWHSGAPNDEAFEQAMAELRARVAERLAALKLEPWEYESLTPIPGVANPKPEFVAEAYGDALVELGAKRKDLVVLDADLAADCRIRKFERAYPERFIENGIAEQDMVSTAGGLALQGLLPVVNSFGTFLSARANEQIYHNACERTKIIYVMHYAGLIPAGPGHSHQSTRDISLMGAMPGFEILEPATPEESRMVLDYCVNHSTSSCVIRLIIGPSPSRIELPAGYHLQLGKGVTLHEGDDAVLFAYGPIMLTEALGAARQLAEHGFGLKVVNMPWLNRIDEAWLRQAIGGTKPIYVIDDHSIVGGLGDALLNTLADTGLIQGRTFRKFAIEGLPAWGTPTEALRFHGLDAASLANRIFGREISQAERVLEVSEGPH